VIPSLQRTQVRVLYKFYVWFTYSFISHLLAICWVYGTMCAVANVNIACNINPMWAFHLEDSDILQ
jgi:hypothetical protein